VATARGVAGPRCDAWGRVATTCQGRGPAGAHRSAPPLPPRSRLRAGNDAARRPPEGRPVLDAHRAYSCFCLRLPGEDGQESSRPRARVNRPQPSPRRSTERQPPSSPRLTGGTRGGGHGRPGGGLRGDELAHRGMAGGRAPGGDARATWSGRGRRHLGARSAMPVPRLGRPGPGDRRVGVDGRGSAEARSRTPRRGPQPLAARGPSSDNRFYVKSRVVPRQGVTKGVLRPSADSGGSAASNGQPGGCGRSMVASEAL
jgi:hypothetical protein